MSNSAKAKGDFAEREISSRLTDLLGHKIERKLGAGRLEDTGDLYGLDEWTAQVAWWPKRGPLRAVREKPIECERQQANAATDFGVTFIRLHGGVWRAVQTIEQWATVYRGQS